MISPTEAHYTLCTLFCFTCIVLFYSVHAACCIRITHSMNVNQTHPVSIKLQDTLLTQVLREPSMISRVGPKLPNYCSRPSPSECGRDYFYSVISSDEYKYCTWHMFVFIVVRCLADYVLGWWSLQAPHWHCWSHGA